MSCSELTNINYQNSIYKASVIHINISYELRHEISNNVVCATSKASDQLAHMRSLIRAFCSHLNILWIEHHLKFLLVKGGCIGSSESTLVNMPHCWKSHTTAHISVLVEWLSTMQETRSIHDSMNRPKMQYIAYTYFF